MEYRACRDNARWSRWFLAAFAALLAGIQTRHLLFLDPWSLAGLGVLRDDAYFYSVLARNFQKFGFLTLDGEMPTNGVQPLWMLLQITLVKLFPWVHEVRLLTVSSWFFYVLFVFSAVWFAFGRALRHSGWRAAIIAFLVLKTTFQRLTLGGLETPLLLTILILTMFDVDDYARPRERQSGIAAMGRTVLLGMFTALCFLVRTDLFWFPVLAAGWLMLREKTIGRQTAVFIVTVSALVVPYLLHNFLAYGSLIPISGRVKVFLMKEMYPTLSSYLRSDEWLGFSTALAKSVGIHHLHQSLQPAVEVAVSFLFLGGQFIVWRSKKISFSAGFKLLSAGALAHLLFMKFLYLENRRYTAYYFAPEVIWFFILAGYLFSAGVDRLGRFRRRGPRPSFVWILQPLTVAALMLTIAWDSGLSTHARPNIVHQQRIAMMKDVDRLLPSQARVGVFWPGLFAQFCGHPTTPMDGVIGSEEYFEHYIKADRELDYLRERGIDYVVLYQEKSPQELLASRIAPRIDSWTHIGTLRVWQNHRRLNVMSVRPTHRNGAGWYLLHISDS